MLPTLSVFNKTMVRQLADPAPTPQAPASIWASLSTLVFGAPKTLVYPHSKLQHPPHPYYPLEAEIIGYLENDRSVLELLGMFSIACVVILGGAVLIARRIRPRITRTELATVCWFVLSGCIHFFFEGYFCYHYKSISSMQTIFAQLWKEYAKSDSRYLAQDPFVVVVESFTAIFWGPMALLTAWYVTVDSPLRYPLQIIVSLGEAYGALLYYATALWDHYAFNISYSRPEAYYFWGYYVMMNFFWIIIPAILIWNGVVAIEILFTDLQKAQKALKDSKQGQANGAPNGAPVANGSTRKHAK